MKVINKKAYYNYSIIDSYTAGIMLTGSEVKSIRKGDINFGDSYIFFNKEGEMFIRNMRVAKYKDATYLNHEEMREKKILLKKREIDKIQRDSKENGVTVVPLEVFFIRNRVKILIGLCRGKKTQDKREIIKKRDIERENQRRF